MKKHIKIFLFLGLGLIALVSGYFQFYVSSENRIVAAPLPGYQDIKKADGINLVAKSGSNTEISGDFGFMFKLTDQVTYEPIGEPIIDPGFSGSKTKVYQFNPANPNVEKGAWVRNAGLYNGRSVDLKFVIDELDFAQKKDGKYPSFRFFAVDSTERNSMVNTPIDTPWGSYFLMVGSGLYSHYEDFKLGDKVRYHYEFYYNDTKENFKLKGSWNFSNVNINKKVAFPFDATDFNKMYVTNDSQIGYKIENTIFEMTSDDEEVDQPTGRLTNLFEREKYEMSMAYQGWDYNDPKPDTGQMAVLYSTESLARIAPATPIVYGERNSSVHTDPKYKTLNYSILQGIADNSKENRNTKFRLETQVPDFYDIQSIEIYEYGTSMKKTDLFTITFEGTAKSKAILTAKDSTSNEFNSSLFDIKVVAKPNDKFKFDSSTTSPYGYVNATDPKDEDNGYMVFEQGGPKTVAYYSYVNDFLNIQNKPLQSNVVKNVNGIGSQAKILYEGLPDAEPKSDIKIPLNTNFETDYPLNTAPLPTDTENYFLKNISVDTDNLIDKPVKVTYSKNHLLPDTSVLGEKSLWLTLTTAKNITKDIEVKVTIVPTAAELRVKYKINGAYMTDKYPDYVDTTQMIGAPINLKNIKQVTDTVSAIKEAGYTQTNTPTEEFTLSGSGNTIVYEFEGTLFLSSSPSILDFGIEEASYKAIRVNEAKLDKALIIKDTRAVKQKWTLTAKLTQDFTLTETDGTKKVIPDILRYNDGTDEEKKFKLTENRDLLVDEHTTSNEYDVSKTWDSKGKGFKLDVPGDAVKTLGKYQAKIEFTVNATP
ncbi:hypothetical protein [Enterococcus ureasiticus]|uniref:WxL domain-containing protein n=1 Tax=Enterococcus ureasiticus TaxID=903984 RepID=A0A1E5GN57_9ENTE|nr:hypothetical protein [Enterococcus ureasiticus]OEG14149.1 hypothetical protein BCR21_03940 [Enterococcus ureasiticus]